MEKAIFTPVSKRSKPVNQGEPGLPFLSREQLACYSVRCNGRLSNLEPINMLPDLNYSLKCLCPLEIHSSPVEGDLTATEPWSAGQRISDPASFCVAGCCL